MNIDLLEDSIKYHGKELFKLIYKEIDPNLKDLSAQLDSKSLIFYSEEEKSVKKLDDSLNPQFNK
jgi:hypothetical protein